MAGIQSVQASAQTQEIKVTIDQASASADAVHAKLAEIAYETA